MVSGTGRRRVRTARETAARSRPRAGGLVRSLGRSRSPANNQYVSGELGWHGDDYGMLRARATSVGSWERFIIVQ